MATAKCNLFWYGCDFTSFPSQTGIENENEYDNEYEKTLYKREKRNIEKWVDTKCFILRLYSFLWMLGAQYQTVTKKKKKQPHHG